MNAAQLKCLLVFSLFALIGFWACLPWLLDRHVHYHGATAGSSTWPVIYMTTSLIFKKDLVKSKPDFSVF
ncbi:hypothetical protein [Candidatus Methylomicrobium oryzae]|jgi:hypothetical protein|uniref:hypothetical protein n=1 Tax=Candidatus Methylomicrobium oryzae TaxID=2802053 RepID=UPI0019242C38|nr:hypothetical protein [Methylomicrobium sp. RS1]